MVELSTKKLLIELGRFYILVWLYIMILEAPNFGQIIITCSMLLESSQRLHNYIHWVYMFKLITVLRLVSTGTSSHFWLELYIVIHIYSDKHYLSYLWGAHVNPTQFFFSLILGALANHQYHPFSNHSKKLKTFFCSLLGSFQKQQFYKECRLAPG